MTRGVVMMNCALDADFAGAFLDRRFERVRRGEQTLSDRASTVSDAEMQASADAEFVVEALFR